MGHTPLRQDGFQRQGCWEVGGLLLPGGPSHILQVNPQGGTRLLGGASCGETARPACLAKVGSASQRPRNTPIPIWVGAATLSQADLELAQKGLGVVILRFIARGAYSDPDSGTELLRLSAFPSLWLRSRIWQHLGGELVAGEPSLRFRGWNFQSHPTPRNGNGAEDGV